MFCVRKRARAAVSYLKPGNPLYVSSTRQIKHCKASHGVPLFDAAAVARACGETEANSDSFDSS